MVMPMDFIPIAEETGLIHEIGTRALNLACQEAATWEGTQTVSVNLSAVQFKNANPVQTVALALADSGLAAQRLELEITESVLLGNSEENVRTLRALRIWGVDFPRRFRHGIFIARVLALVSVRPDQDRQVVRP